MDRIKCQCGAVIAPNSYASHIKSKKHICHPSFSTEAQPLFEAASSLSALSREPTDGETRCEDCGAIIASGRTSQIIHERTQKHRDAVYAILLNDAVEKARAMAITNPKAARAMPAPRVPPPPRREPRLDNVAKPVDPFA